MTDTKSKDRNKPVSLLLYYSIGRNRILVEKNFSEYRWSKLLVSIIDMDYYYYYYEFIERDVAIQVIYASTIRKTISFG